MTIGPRRGYPYDGISPSPTRIVRLPPLSEIFRPTPPLPTPPVTTPLLPPLHRRLLSLCRSLCPSAPSSLQMQVPWSARNLIFSHNMRKDVEYRIHPMFYSSLLFSFSLSLSLSVFYSTCYPALSFFAASLQALIRICDFVARADDISPKHCPLLFRYNCTTFATISFNVSFLKF